MLRVIFKLIVTQPELLLAHVQNYADLIVEGLHATALAWKLRLLCYVLSAALLALSVLCGAGSLLLWGALPLLHPEHAWVLVALPLVLFIISVLFYFAAKSYKINPLFDDIQEQLSLDMLAICQAHAK